MRVQWTAEKKTAYRGTRLDNGAGVHGGWHIAALLLPLADLHQSHNDLHLVSPCAQASGLLYIIPALLTSLPGPQWFWQAS